MGRRRYKPLPDKRKAPKPPALIVAGTGGIELWTEHGARLAAPGEDARRLLAEHSGYRVFSHTKLNVTIAALDARHGEGSVWRKAAIAFKPDDGPKIIGTRNVFKDATPEEAFAAILVVDEYARAHGVNFTSFGWTSEQFWRRTLRKPVSIGSPSGRHAVYGGRKECRSTDTYRDMRYVDLRAAYPSAMVGEPFPIELVPVRDIDAPVGVASASVEISEDENGWLPIHKPMPYGMAWIPGEHRGWWTFRELRLAREHGYRVRIRAAFGGRAYSDLFGPWLAMMMTGRDLPGHAGRVMKAIANSLWGTFGMEGSVRTVRFEDRMGTRIATVLRERKSPPSGAGFLAAETSARVRERVYRELVPSNPVYIDTDGGVIRAGSPIPAPDGDGLGEWSVREMMSTFEAAGSQAYRFVDYQDRESVIIAGVAGASRADLANRPEDGAMPTGVWRVPRRPEEPRYVDERGVAVHFAHDIDPLPDGWIDRQLELWTPA